MQTLTHYKRICPDCKVDRQQLILSLAEGAESDNFQYAARILDSCPDCKITIPAIVNTIVARGGVNHDDSSI